MSDEAFDPTHPDDLALAQSAVAGDREARRQFAQRMQCVPRMLVVMNRRLVGRVSNEDIEDLVQDTLVTVWRRLDTFGGRASLETWVYRFCRYHLANRIRSLARRPVHVTVETYDQSQETTSTLLEFEDVHRALGELEQATADVLRLKHFRQLSFPEIGTALGISPNTAKTRYYRGLTVLRRMLEPGRREVDS